MIGNRSLMQTIWRRCDDGAVDHPVRRQRAAPPRWQNAAGVALDRNGVATSSVFRLPFIVPERRGCRPLSTARRTRPIVMPGVVQLPDAIGIHSMDFPTAVYQVTEDLVSQWEGTIESHPARLTGWEPKHTVRDRPRSAQARCSQVRQADRGTADSSWPRRSRRGWLDETSPPSGSPVGC